MKRLLQGKRPYFETEETVNPMDGVANLVDVMIVFSVGIMLALIMHWNLDTSLLFYTETGTQNDTGTHAGTNAQGGASTGSPLPIGAEDMHEVTEDAEQIIGEDMERFGAVYYDRATGKYYLVTD